MLRKVLTIVFALIAASVIAVGIGTYVYPSKPWLVWGLLFLCWVCYRLHLRARALFGPRPQEEGQVSSTRAHSRTSTTP